jgi:hypothetical protein
MRRHRRSQDRLGITLVTAQLLVIALMFWACVRIDAAHGITPCQSLSNWGMHLC